MASSYTTNSGIEKPAQGDQTGSWGTTINTNMDIIDRSINGVLALTLTGTTTTLTTTDGTLTDGMYKVLVLGGSPSGTNTITVAPNDADKLYFVVNSSGQTATFTQGSGADVSVLNGDTAVIYCDGAGSGAAVADFTKDLGMSSVNIDGGTIDGTVIGGATAAAGTFTTVTASGTLGVTGVATHGDDVVSDTDSTDDLGTTGVRWANLFVDAVTITGEATATGFTGTLDGILGSGAAAAAATTTLDTSGVVNLNLTTDSTSSTSGALIVDGGVGIAKKLFVGTDFDVSGNAVIDGTALTTGVHTFTATPVFSSDVTIEDDLFLDSDGAVIHLGEDNEITLTHSADSGLILGRTSTADDAFSIFTLSTGDNDIAAGDKLGQINWSAPNEGAGTDAIATAASIFVASEGDFSASNNATTMYFSTSTSGQPTERMKITSAGNVVFPTDAMALEFGAHPADTSLTHVADTGLLLNRTMMAPGAVVQRPYVYHTSSTQLTSAGALHELSTSLRVAITPKHASSILFLECSAWLCSPNSINIHWAHFYDVTNTEVPFLPTASGSRSRVHWSMRVSDDDANDFHNMNFIVAGTAGSTDARTYTIWHGTEGATAEFLASTLSSATGVTAPIFFSVTEIYNP